MRKKESIVNISMDVVKNPHGSVDKQETTKAI
jgi:hypothetical protein